MARSLQHGRRGRGEVLRLDLHGDMLLNQRMPGQMAKLRAERLPDLVIARPGPRIARLHSELNVVEKLEFPVAEGHFDGRTVVEAAIAGDVRLPVGQAAFTTT